MVKGMEYLSEKGHGRTQVSLQATDMGPDLLVRVFNSRAHVGAVAIGEWDAEHQRASVSVLTRLGHKDDAIAQKAAYSISKNTRKAVCVVAGVHLDNISSDEIQQVLENANELIWDLLSKI
jgi:gallate decarboxylase subunit D